MGSPNMWYKDCLEYFVFYSSNEKDHKNIEKMSITELEAYVLEKRTQISEKDFYYLAGMSAHVVADESCKCGCDAMNAAACGISDFESFIDIDYTWL